MSITDELQKLQDLRQSGALTEEEFTRAKEAILNSGAEKPSPPPSATIPPLPTPPSPEAREQQTRQWAMFIHLGLLANYVLPPAGFILPVVLWQIKKDELPGVDQHGKNACNWIITALIYGAIGLVLCLACGLGVLLLIPLGIAGIVLPIIAGIKANNGETWSYPLSIPFLR